MNGEHVETMPEPKTGKSRYKRERETTIQDAAPRMSKSLEEISYPPKSSLSRRRS